MKIQVVGDNISQEEVNEYIKYGKNKYQNRNITEITIKADGDYVDLKFSFEKVPMERIRRITGYLVGTTDRFNDAKRSEEQQRVKHSL